MQFERKCPRLCPDKAAYRILKDVARHEALARSNSFHVTSPFSSLPRWNIICTIHTSVQEEGQERKKQNVLCELGDELPSSFYQYLPTKCILGIHSWSYLQQ